MIKKLVCVGPSVFVLFCFIFVLFDTSILTSTAFRLERRDYHEESTPVRVPETIEKKSRRGPGPILEKVGKIFDTKFYTSDYSDDPDDLSDSPELEGPYTSVSDLGPVKRPEENDSLGRESAGKEKEEGKTIERDSIERDSIERESVEKDSTKGDYGERDATERETVEREPVEREPVEREPVEREPVEREPLEREPLEREPVEREPVEREPVEREPLEREPVERKPVEREPVEQEPLEREPVERKPVEREPVEKDLLETDPASEIEAGKEKPKEKKEQSDSELIVVHLVPHSHDVGWLKTVDEYYLGTNDTDQSACVKCILEGVASALIEGPGRRFSVVEMAYFKRWWLDLLENDSTRGTVNSESVRELIRKGQISFVGGGMSMNDEACVHFRDAITNMEYGFEFLNEFFDIPRTQIGWHLDPFGHASTQAALFAEMGLDGFVITRVDQNDKEMRRLTKKLEFNWVGSESRGEASKIFTSIVNGHYDEFDPALLQNQELENDKELERDGILNSLVDLVRKFREESETKNVLIPVGSDFSFPNTHAASLIFKNLDVLKSYINANPSKYGMEIIYSTPPGYVNAVKTDLETSAIPLDTKVGDFFPYIDYGAWTGFYTSRPAFKRQVRTASAFFSASTSLISQYQLLHHKLSPYGYEEITRLGEEIGIVQHHDAVSGTARERVVEDYEEHLNEAIAAMEKNVIGIANEITFDGKLSYSGFQTCKRLNESVCAPTNDLANGQDLTIALYNPICQPRNHSARIPIPIIEVAVFDSDMQPIVSQVIIEDASMTSSHELIFTVPLRPCSLTNVVIKSKFSDVANAKASVLTSRQPIVDSMFEHGEVKLLGTGMTRIQIKKTGSNIDFNLIFNFGTSQESMVSHDYFWYQPSAKDGAYIFRPRYQDPFPIDGQKALFVVEGPVVDEVHMVYNGSTNDELSVRDRLSLLSSEPEIAHLCATVKNIGKFLGGEYVVRYKTGLQSSSMYTDSMAMELLKRNRRDKKGNRKSVEENYYPINSALVLKSDEPKEEPSKLSFAIMNDRSQGGTSLDDETAEIMLHRRAITDDLKGLGETLAEVDDSGNGLAVTTEHVLAFGSGDQFAKNLRKHTLYIANPVMMLFTSSNEASSIVTSRKHSEKGTFSLLGSLPDNVHLLSAKPVYCANPTISLGKNNIKISEMGYCDSLMLKIRLHHIFAKYEHSVLSLPAKINLEEVFGHLSALKAIHELELGGTKEVKNGSSIVDPEQIVLQPMQIRTFLVIFSERKHSTI
eukprot:Nk52_evm10s1837 gene=Nk52_evmTU10s1837